MPTIEDRLIQFSLLHLLREPLKSKGLLNTISYGLVAQSGRTVQDARTRATILRQSGQRVYKADIQKFFDRIPRDSLKSHVKRIVPFPTLHSILIAFSEVEIGDGFAADWEKVVANAGIQAGIGVRQGMPLSPYFAGVILRDLDRLIERRNLPVIRYVDDIIGFFSSEEECKDFDGFLREELAKLSLSLGVIGEPGSKCGIYRPEDPVDFVGMEMKFNATGKCFLYVSERTLERLEGRIAEMTKIDVLLQKRITLPYLGARLEAMRKGYIAAYHGAANMDELKARVRAISEPVVASVLESIFGSSMNNLNRKQRTFLGIG